MAHDKTLILATLAESEPFASASAAERETLAAAASLFRYPAGATVFLEGERSPAAWVVRSGRVRILNFLNASRTFQVERLGPRQLFGVCCRVGGGVDRYLCTAVAEGDLEAVRVPDAAFHSLYRQSPAAARATCELCVSRLRVMRRAAKGQRRGALARLAQVLLGLRQTGGDEIRATRHALAGWVGSTPETVFRSLRTLRKRKVVATGRGVVRVLDAAALARAADGEDGGA